MSVGVTTDQKQTKQKKRNANFETGWIFWYKFK